ncbi:MAG: bifunctional pyr operon transcriptional regulator/uracil phosphoribosyltransferase PyrR [Candidatus Binatia bacterium]
MPQEKRVLLEKQDIVRTVARMAHEIVEKAAGPGGLVLIGIRSRGVHLARRLARKIEEFSSPAPSIGAIDVSRYRDDRTQSEASANVSRSEILVTVDEKTVVLVDDVIFRGRTIRAAMQAVNQLGQPTRILLAVLVDRGARELPIRADIVGKNIEANDSQRVNVLLEESDGIDQVILSQWDTRSKI